MNVCRTVTIEKYRGNGIAGKITKELFEYAKKENYLITADCWYTPKFWNKPENQQLYKDIFKAKI